MGVVIVMWKNSKGVLQERQFDKASALLKFVGVLVAILEPGTEIKLVKKQEELKG